MNLLGQHILVFELDKKINEWLPYIPEIGILVKEEAFQGHIAAEFSSCRSGGAGSRHKMVQEGDFNENFS